MSTLPYLTLTADGSHTVVNPAFGESYHSENGALQESLHVFIDAGFRRFTQPEVAVFEVGFGTGLNALLTLLEAQKTQQTVYYEAIELYPIAPATASTLNYAAMLEADKQLFEKLHNCAWDSEVPITPLFSIRKIKCDLQAYQASRKYDVIYFDAFSANTQPELWSPPVFEKMYNMLNFGGVLVTYSSKGIVKRGLRAAGFTVQRLAGTNGKRHMVRAIKEEKEGGAME